MKRATLTLWIVAIVGAACLLGGTATRSFDTTPPTMTVPPCAAWADTSIPDLPDHTYTDRCVSDDGTIVYSQNPEEHP